MNDEYRRQLEAEQLLKELGVPEPGATRSGNSPMLSLVAGPAELPGRVLRRERAYEQARDLIMKGMAA